MENDTGFVKSGYINKKGAPSGDSAKFNVLPPGQNIEDQPNADVSEMTMKKITPLGYPGSGWKE